MKLLRLLLLSLLVCLLPVRGLQAATMACAQGQAGAHPMQMAADEMEQAMHHHLSQTDEGGHDIADGPAQAADADGDASASCHDTCPICASGCHALALAARLPLLPAPTLSAVLAYPRLAAPSPAFLMDGHERPPRTA